mgnify:CR=1 FL=1
MTMHPYSAQLGPSSRAESWRELTERELDVLVIGGGVTGAGTALDAVTRGLRTGLVEARDFASGTSSRSSKLFHGGLRYLEQLNFALVAEALETVKCFDEGVLDSVADANIGSIFGIGFPAWTGGVLQYINPTLQFLCAVLLFGEAFTRWHAIAYAMIWSALALYTLSAFRAVHARNRDLRAGVGG